MSNDTPIASVDAALAHAMRLYGSDPLLGQIHRLENPSVGATTTQMAIQNADDRFSIGRWVFTEHQHQ